MLFLTCISAATAIFALGLIASTTTAQRVDAPRIAPVPRAEWTEAQKAIIDPIIAGGRDYNVYTTMLNHPDLMRDWLVFGQHILRDNTLPARDREMLILRIGWLCQSECEWSRHVPIGMAAGLTDADLEYIMAGPSEEGSQPQDQSLLRSVDELHGDAFITDATWAALSAHYGKEQMMDLVFTVGQYNLVSMALNSFGVQLDADVTGFPE